MKDFVKERDIKASAFRHWVLKSLEGKQTQRVGRLNLRVYPI